MRRTTRPRICFPYSTLNTRCFKLHRLEGAAEGVLLSDPSPLGKRPIAWHRSPMLKRLTTSAMAKQATDRASATWQLCPQELVL
eukprot:s3163_g11.t1